MAPTTPWRWQAYTPASTGRDRMLPCITHGWPRHCPSITTWQICLQTREWWDTGGWLLGGTDTEVLRANISVQGEKMKQELVVGIYHGCGGKGFTNYNLLPDQFLCMNLWRQIDYLLQSNMDKPHCGIWSCLKLKILTPGFWYLRWNCLQQRTAL